jgi:hypothetical protein
MFQPVLLDSLAIHRCPVGARKIDKQISIRVGDELGMLSGNVTVGHENIRIGIPAERHFGIRECEHVLFTILIFPFDS